ncbi:MAG: hypothetical protein ABIS14_10140 [Sphingomonas sp.]
MKKIFTASVAVFALLSATAASATTHSFYPGEYAPGYQPPSWGANGVITDDTTTATPTVTNSFTLTGNVAKDCSFFGGSSTSHSIPMGAIGVKNGNTENVPTAFNQAADFSFDLGTTSAGCNFNNTVTVSKSAQGLVNAAAGGYDNTQFTANIPYSILAGLTGTTNTGAGAAGAYIPMTVAANAASSSEHLGAWRSAFNMRVAVPAQTLGLVAGTYTDTITVTLAVDTA